MNHQADHPDPQERERGLSYYEAVPLDGRLDPSRGRPAREWLQQAGIWGQVGVRLAMENRLIMDLDD